MSKIDLYSNEKALRVMMNMTKIALKAHANSPSPVEIKLELDALPADMLMQIEEDIAAALEPFNVIDIASTHDDYWDCNCPENYIHAKTEESCPKCKAHHSTQPDIRVCEVEEFINGK